MCVCVCVSGCGVATASDGDAAKIQLAASLAAESEQYAAGNGGSKGRNKAKMPKSIKRSAPHIKDDGPQMAERLAKKQARLERLKKQLADEEEEKRKGTLADVGAAEDAGKEEL